jgi:hypothetical protein
MKIRCFDIVWDCDDEEIDLPSSVVIDVEDEEGEYAFVDTAAADALSDRFGWCVESLSVEWVRG